LVIGVVLMIWTFFKTLFAGSDTKESRMANAQNQGGTQSAGAVGTPGNFWQHVNQLADQLIAGDWAGGMTTFADIMTHLSQQWGAFQAIPAHTMAAAAPGAGGTVQGAQVGQQLKQLAQQHQGATQGAAGAFPWQVILQTLGPLLMQALQALLSRQ
jgi:hypothetical protein